MRLIRPLPRAVPLSTSSLYLTTIVISKGSAHLAVRRVARHGQRQPREMAPQLVPTRHEGAAAAAARGDRDGAAEQRQALAALVRPERNLVPRHCTSLLL